MSITDILREAGYEVVEGADEVRAAIKKAAGKKNLLGSLCSGYGVFPDGTKCPGCMDCRSNKNKT